MMFDKNIRRKSDVSNDVLVINSYDDSVHNQTKKGRTSIVLFNSQIFSATTIKGGVSPTKSMNIITWQK